ncbi:uncharacterized protein LOC110873659 isoform X2 [Helianthus annuus]|uniref:uncharacterized protein LOC110873659 isoform X2 n=1 Tax=Helianthus annuus TaxID=4232 RepID=UPI000B909B0A|nr:uncharacterized protein LOC110873659 isoform X2 [Helianthus annuus]XP_021978335.1 uncharacterized protein LOC110873659 isoform X2 [Helianthus annuus]XP_021978336.1 uncharacterized protein LOC110873659 isoform X2 [Helianthus annuus]XP_021978338.1 uncharacterized protein LOC110873659 isoform X2 [Helianthus annuus]XP_035832142.1 uncharacterized protein LOC110873659 isoform X2 [Helianthus annuus]XP_035832143.1 uncharacterized protein LOC110873659 isoform X2 [Helianthus annuus]
MLGLRRFETIMFKLEVLDHKAREKAGVITPTFGAPIPVLLTFDAAVEALQSYQLNTEFFSPYTITGKKSGKDGKNLFCGVCSHLHQLTIPTHTTYLDQGKKLTYFTQEECKERKTTCSHLKSFVKLDATLSKQKACLRL